MAAPNVLRSVLGATQETWLLLYIKKNWMHLCLQRPFPFLQHSLDACPWLGTFHHLSHSPQIHTTTQGSFQSGGPPPGFLRCLHLDHAESLKGTNSKEEFSERFSATTPCCPKRAMEDLLEQKKRA